MPELKATTREGEQHTLDVSGGTPIMEPLRDEDLGVEGTCGGMCSCGTCHIYVDEAWLDKLPPKSEDEEMMLEAIGELVEIRPNSRLSCQIPLTDELEGLEIQIGPVA